MKTLYYLLISQLLFKKERWSE